MDRAAIIAKLEIALGILAEIHAHLSDEVVGADGDQGSCPHPNEARVNLTGMGETPHFHCRACGKTVAGEVPDGEISSD